mgnify:CR=1 FL=1
MPDARRASLSRSFHYVLGALSFVVGAIGYLFFELQFALTALLSFFGLSILNFLIRDLWGLFRLIAHKASSFRSVSQNESVDRNMPGASVDQTAWEPPSTRTRKS